MDNRNRDKMSKESSSSTEAGNVNRKTSQDIGNVESDSNASFAQNIGRSENMENEPSRRSGSSGSMGSSSRSSNLGEQSESSSSSDRSDRSYGDKRSEH